MTVKIKRIIENICSLLTLFKSLIKYNMSNKIKVVSQGIRTIIQNHKWELINIILEIVSIFIKWILGLLISTEDLDL